MLATARALALASGEQHRGGPAADASIPSPAHMKTPSGRYPASLTRYAATDESTPPDMATTTFSPLMAAL